MPQPGAGPVVFSEKLARFAPVPFVRLTASGAEFIESRRQAGDSAEPFGRITAFHGQMGMFVRAMSYMLAHGADGMRQASEDAVLNANYIKARLSVAMSPAFPDGPCMDEALFNDTWLDGTGITSLPESICELTELDELNVGDNPITRLPQEIGRLTKMKWLGIMGGTQLAPEEIARVRAALPEANIR